MPNIPLPETPIDATDCRLNLLLHITDMQNEVNTRLESLEGLFEGLFFYWIEVISSLLIFFSK